MTRRGDNIPSVAEYSHWNEDAELMWYQENRFDMMHADEELDDYDDNPFEGYDDEEDEIDEED